MNQNKRDLQEYNRIYYASNKERLSVIRKGRTEHKRIIQAKYYENNKEKIKANQKQYYLKKKEKTA